MPDRSSTPPEQSPDPYALIVLPPPYVIPNRNSRPRNLAAAADANWIDSHHTDGRVTSS
jgi:hypothetical protein